MCPYYLPALLLTKPTTLLLAKKSYDSTLITTLYSLRKTLEAMPLEWTEREVERDGETLTIKAPEHWSDTAVRIMALKYMRRAGVPKSVKRVAWPEDTSLPGWLLPHEPAEGTEFGSETSLCQVFIRIAGHWTFAAWNTCLLSNDEDLWTFFVVCFRLMALQIAAPHSPQFFNTGLWWSYGLKGRNDHYTTPQTSACFILGVKDNLIEEDGIFNTLFHEATIFKYGSGAGANFSRLRPKGAALSSGGKSSGLMSFLKVLDSAAGAIKSGGTTRRAVKILSKPIHLRHLVDEVDRLLAASGERSGDGRRTATCLSEAGAADSPTVARR